MFRRKREEASPQTSADSIKAAAELLTVRSEKQLLELALAHALELAPAATRAYAVIRQGTDKIAAVKGYSQDFVDLELVGPWNDGTPRISSNLSGDLFNPNVAEVRAKLGAMGLREVRNALIAPMRDTGGSKGVLGALVLDAYGNQSFEPTVLEAVQRWSWVVSQSLTLIRQLGYHRQLAWHLTLAFIEAIEAQDFTQLGHAQRVTSYAMALAREIGLSSQEQNDVWFAAMLHNLGRLSGEGLEPAAVAGLGFNILSHVQELEASRVGILHVFEHWDGTGAPKKLNRNAIPIFSRIIAISNAYDSLTSERGEELNSREALERMRFEAGKIYDPELIERFASVLAQNKATAELRQGSLFPA